MNIPAGTLERTSGTLQEELEETSRLLVRVTETQGVYFAVAFLYDAGYTPDRIKKLLPILQKERGARKDSLKD